MWLTPSGNRETQQKMRMKPPWGAEAGAASPAMSPRALFLHVTLQEEDDGGVALRCLLELLQGDLVILVLVHLCEDLVNTFLRCQPVLVHPHHDHSPHHLVNGLEQKEEQSTRVGMLDGEKVPGQGRGQDCCSAGTQLAAGTSYNQVHTGYILDKALGRKTLLFCAKRDPIVVKSLEKASYPC